MDECVTIKGIYSCFLCVANDNRAHRWREDKAFHRVNRERGGAFNDADQSKPVQIPEENRTVRRS